MDPINAATTLAPTNAARPTNSFADLGSDDFFRLMITQLTNQDPLEPTGNEELLRQISSIRDIELSTSLTQSLQTLTGQQNFASASSLIGQYVTSQPDADGLTRSGLVTAVRFEPNGRPVLQLSNGMELPLEQVGAVQPPLQAGEALVGRHVIGLDRTVAAIPRAVEGTVSGTRLDAARGEVLLELDSGEALRLRDLLSVVPDES